MKPEITYYWSRKPGSFVNKNTGEENERLSNAFRGSIREWYETLSETIIDVANKLDGGEYMRRTIFVATSVKSMLECSVLFRSDVKYTTKSSHAHNSVIGTFANMDLVFDKTQSRDEIIIVTEQNRTDHKTGVVKVLDLY